MSTYHVPARRADAIRAELSGTEVQHLLIVGTLPGVSPQLAAGRNGPGEGALRLTGAAGNEIAWRAPGSATFGEPVLCSSDGAVLLEDGEDANKWLRAYVYTSFLQGSGEATVYLRQAFNELAGDDVTAGEATAGDVATFQVTLVNDSPMTVLDLTAWLDPSATGLELSDDGVSFSTPTTEGAGLTWASVAPATNETLYVRRTVSAGAAADPDLLNLIQLSWLGF